MSNNPGMIDVSSKDVTVRTAKASGSVILGAEAFQAIKGGTSIKGDVLETEKIAAVNAVKATSTIIPMCHPVLTEAVNVDFALSERNKSITVSVAVKSSGKTGVEMEALCGVTVACLTVYDMLKYLGKAMTITQVELIEKTGGKSGDYKRQD